MDIEKAIKVMPNDKIHQIISSLKKELKLRRSQNKEIIKEEKNKTLRDYVNENYDKDYKYIKDLLNERNMLMDEPAEPRGIYGKLGTNSNKKAYIHLLNQNWSCTYPRDTDSGEYYVYAHVDPSGKFSVADIIGGDLEESLFI